MKRQPTSYSDQELRKMNTDRLNALHVRIFGAWASDPFNREEILAAVGLACWEARRAERSHEEVVAEKKRDAQIEWRQFEQWLKDLKAEREGRDKPALSEHDVRSIRAMHNGGVGYKEIGKLYGKQPNYIRNVVIGKIYKWVS